MKDRKDLLLYKVIIWICTVFMALTLFILNNNVNKGKEEDIYESKDAINSIESISDIVVSQISEITKGSISVKLPDNINKSSIYINKDLMRKKIIIEFPQGNEEYDFSNIDNSMLSQAEIDYFVKNNIVNVEINCSSVLDCIESYEEEKLILEFFIPSDVDVPVVVIDAGHGGSDIGFSKEQIFEKDINLEICDFLKQFLDSEKMLVYYTRQDDSYLDETARINFINEIMPDIFISIHSNICEDEQISGISILYDINNENEYDSEWLSGILYDEISKSCELYVKKDAGEEEDIVKNVNVPVALIEVGFMSNDMDFKLITENSGQIKVAKSIYSGIIKSLIYMGKYRV